MRQENPRGGRSPLTEEQQRLAEDYLPMARSLARPFKEQYPDEWEEFESAACLALVEAARNYRPDRGVRFPSFARRRVFGALRDVRRERIERGRKECPGLDEGSPGTVRLTEDTELHGRPVATGGTAPRDVGAELEQAEAIERLLGKLPKTHAAACRLIYVGGLTHVEAAKELGVTPSRVTYIHVEALAMLAGTWDGRTRPTAPTGPRRRGRPPKVKRPAVA